MTDTPCTFDDVAYGVPIRFTADSPQLLAAMQKCAPWQQNDQDTPAATMPAVEFSLSRSGREFKLQRDGLPCCDSDDVHEVLAQLASEAMVHVADHAPDRVFLHAGVVAWNGRGMVMPGSSFAGKSTLVAALVQAGATYYSDEYAVIDAGGMVHPYARDLSLRGADGTAQRTMSVAELGGHAGTAPVSIAHVVFAEYADSATWKPEPITCGAAALEMMRHAIAVQRAPQRVMSALAAMLDTATIVRSQRGDAAHTAAILLQRMSESHAQ
jgi:hypothetical protein